jgi:uncharacterized protein
MLRNFGITLMLTHACNLRCTYCYTGTKINRAMPLAVGQKAINRAAASVRTGGTLEISFFGGEPLLESKLLLALVAHARQQVRARGLSLSMALTTNGTVKGPDAWSVLMMPEMDLSISCDGAPRTHDRHRQTADGRGTAHQVVDTIARLVAQSRDFHVVIVVRPDTLGALPASIRFLESRGVRSIQPSLDLWTRWSVRDLVRLERVVARCARLWRSRTPQLSIGWFDEKAGRLLGAHCTGTARCGFGHNELAVAPSGRLYPCERLIGEDAPDNPMALPGNAMEGEDFLQMRESEARSHPACDDCAMSTACNTVCRCSNYIRTGQVSRPDGLLCTLNKACLVETARVLRRPIHINVCPKPKEVYREC